MPRPRNTSSWNPLAFVPAQVTLITSAVYIALFAVLLYTHHTVPSAPNDVAPEAGVNLTRAWLDLDYLSDGFHPVDSQRNDRVREWLVKRVQEVLHTNGAGYDVIGDEDRGGSGNGSSQSSHAVLAHKKKKKKKEGAQDQRATLWTTDNATAIWYAPGRGTQYTESTNLVVYIRGSSDPAGRWWEGPHAYEGPGGVLVNAHYDSVPSGYGATDDGIGVITVLQLLSHFTSPDTQQPSRGIVLLLNNAEENGLHGAHAFLRHPLAQFTHTFLNLEGAGAGGKAMLFRSTDAAVTRHYARSPYPFGNVVSADGFKRGLIRSATDYQVFVDNQGMRGLDVAFYQPRARYHTVEDDARDTSPDSVWHMLSASLATVRSLSSSVSAEDDEFEGGTARNGRVVMQHRGSEGVWWDFFGRVFAVLSLPTLFAFSVTLLTAGPVLLIVLEALIRQSGKWYPFARKGYPSSALAEDYDEDDNRSQDESSKEPVRFNGIRGVFRFPVAVAVATSAVIALALLLTKINPYIAYSSPYAVWSLVLCAFFFLSWFILAGADRVRPTALQRFYCLLWLYILTWIMLVGATVGENNYKLASGYFIVIYNATVWVALVVGYLEMLGLPTKKRFVEYVCSLGLRGHVEDDANEDEGDAAMDESTSLLRGRRGEQRKQNQGTFANTAGGTATKHGGRQQRRTTVDSDPHDSEDDQPHSRWASQDDPLLTHAYGAEQAWSSSLPQWSWTLQFLLVAPLNLILVGQIALLATASLHQTPADGNPALPIYLAFAGLTTLLLLPLTPFLHRWSYHLPTFSLLIGVGCVVYCLLAFPFSPESPMKIFFVQRVDLDLGKVESSLIGLPGFVEDVLAEVPSSVGQRVDCRDGIDEESSWTGRDGLRSCVWEGLWPDIVPHHAVTSSAQTAQEVSREEGGNDRSPSSDLAPYTNGTKKSPPQHPDPSFKSWLDFNLSLTGPHSASLTFQGRNTRQYRLSFPPHQPPPSSLKIHNGNLSSSVEDPRFGPPLPPSSSSSPTTLRIIPRTWDARIRVDISWPEKEAQNVEGFHGEVMALWSDANQPGVIPGFDEVRRFAPRWSLVTKGDDGLVLGVRGWRVSSSSSGASGEEEAALLEEKEEK
ncbi:endoplasmic reticulum metallopeptidase 1 [Hortaea werneckii]|nr:endoplasmic reticulum metallopeptidase 1 [Hortaea werneckii]